MKIGKPQAAAPQKEKKEYALLPKSQFLVSFDKFEIKKTKDGTGTYLDATFKVAEGDHKNRLIFHKFHVENKNPKAAQIGMEQLDKLVKCMGERGGFSALDFDTDRLDAFKGKSVMANVGVEKGTNGYRDRNKITSFALR